MNVRQVKTDLLKDLLKIDITALKGLVSYLDKEVKKTNPRFNDIDETLVDCKKIADDARKEIKRYS